MNIGYLLKNLDKIALVLKKTIKSGNKELVENLIPIVRNLWLTNEYALIITKSKIKDEWEEIITQDFFSSYYYALYVLKGEDVISKNIAFSYRYAKEVLKGPFLKGEKTIIKNKTSLKKCVSFLKSIKKLKKFLKNLFGGKII